MPAGTLTACNGSKQSMMMMVVVMAGMKIMMTMNEDDVDGTVTTMMATKR